MINFFTPFHAIFVANFSYFKKNIYRFIVNKELTYLKDIIIYLYLIFKRLIARLIIDSLVSIFNSSQNQNELRNCKNEINYHLTRMNSFFYTKNLKIFHISFRNVIIYKIIERIIEQILFESN